MESCPVYLVNSVSPMQPIELMYCEIRRFEKTVWAVLPNKKRKRIGKTAFTTLSEANEAKLNYLIKFIDGEPKRTDYVIPYNGVYDHHHYKQVAIRIVEHYKMFGDFDLIRTGTPVLKRLR